MLGMLCLGEEMWGCEMGYGIAPFCWDGDSGGVAGDVVYRFIARWWLLRLLCLRHLWHGIGVGWMCDRDAVIWDVILLFGGGW